MLSCYSAKLSLLLGELRASRFMHGCCRVRWMGGSGYLKPGNKSTGFVWGIGMFGGSVQKWVSDGYTLITTGLFVQVTLIQCWVAALQRCPPLSGLIHESFCQTVIPGNCKGHCICPKFLCCKRWCWSHWLNWPACYIWFNYIEQQRP